MLHTVMRWSLKQHHSVKQITITHERVNLVPQKFNVVYIYSIAILNSSLKANGQLRVGVSNEYCLKNDC